MNTQQISTDLLYEFLADPNKLQPVKHTAHIINNENESDNNESFIVDYNNNINNDSPKLNFNSDKNHNNINDNIKLSSSSKRYSSRLSMRERSNSSNKNKTDGAE